MRQRRLALCCIAAGRGAARGPAWRGDEAWRLPWREFLAVPVTVMPMRPSVVLAAIHDATVQARARQLRKLVGRTRRAPRRAGASAVSLRGASHRGRTRPARARPGSRRFTHRDTAPLISPSIPVTRRTWAALATDEDRGACWASICTHSGSAARAGLSSSPCGDRVQRLESAVLPGSGTDASRSGGVPLAPRASSFQIRSPACARAAPRCAHEKGAGYGVPGASGTHGRCRSRTADGPGERSV